MGHWPTLLQLCGKRTVDNPLRHRPPGSGLTRKVPRPNCSSPLGILPCRSEPVDSQFRPPKHAAKHSGQTWWLDMVVGSGKAQGFHRLRRENVMFRHHVSPPCFSVWSGDCSPYELFRTFSRAILNKVERCWQACSGHSGTAIDLPWHGIDGPALRMSKPARPGTPAPRPVRLNGGRPGAFDQAFAIKHEGICRLIPVATARRYTPERPGLKRCVPVTPRSVAQWAKVWIFPVRRPLWELS